MLVIPAPLNQSIESLREPRQRPVHVPCGEAVAHTAADAEAMIAACQAGNVLLMTAYRLHFEEGNLQAIEAVKKEKIGEARLFISTHTMQVDPG